MAQMANTSKETVVIDDKTKHLHMTVYGSKALSALFSNTHIETIYMDGVEKLNLSYFFELARSLKAAVFPDVNSISAYVFWNTYQDPAPGIDLYKKITFPSSTPFRLEGGANIILRANELCPTSFTANTWGMSSGIKFFVPQSLLTTYREATNWDTFGDSRILPIEGSQFENINWWKSV